MQDSEHDQKLKMAGTLAASIAHEINNPTTWILQNLEFLKNHLKTLRHCIIQLDSLKESDPAFQIQQLQHILTTLKPLTVIDQFNEILTETTEGATRIRDIIRDFKSFTRINDKKNVATDIHQVLNSIIKITSPSMKLKAHFEKQYAKDIPLLNLPSGQLHQVLLNLVMNAAQSIAEGDPQTNKITLTTKQENNNLRIDIADTGSGIPPENLSKIFEPFFTTKTSDMGTGLGLAISKDIIQQLGGTITVQSQLGKGTLFSIVLPLHLAKTILSEKTDSSTSPISGKKILIVDDEPYLLKSLKRMLEDQHQVFAALSSEAAMEILSQNASFDLIVIDLGMPEKSGADLYHQIEKNHPELVKNIIFMSGGAYTPALKAFLENINNPCLDKPFSQEELMAAMSVRSEL